jgi:hypothetical protein
MTTFSYWIAVRSREDGVWKYAREETPLNLAMFLEPVMEPEEPQSPSITSRV